MPVDPSTLNDGQLQAVHAPLDRPTLVIAGAGSGKTTTLTARLEHIVTEGVNRDHVVAMTFTRKAAGEFAQRLAGGPAEGIWSGTIHSFAYARLKAWLEATGQEMPDILVHTKSTVRNLMGRPSRHQADLYREAVVDCPELDLSSVLGAIGHWQNELLDPQAARAEANESGDWLAHWCSRIYDAYTRWKRRTGHVDFGDMLALAVDAYQTDPEFLRGDRRRYRWALVDELQDTNTAQWALIRLLWTGQPLFGVGDPRQAIYEWRGARPDQLMAFTRTWRDAEIVSLDLNYRSIPSIIETAEALIVGTPEATVSGRLRPTRDGGVRPQLIEIPDHYAEADFVVDTIRNTWRTMKVDRPGDIAVLYRTNAQSADFEDALSTADIPYQVVGSKGFWARKEVTQLLAYLRLTIDPNDHEAFRLALMAPSRFLGNAFISAVDQLARDREISLVEACSGVTSYSGRALNAGQADAASDFTTLVRSIRTMPPGAALEHVLRVTGFRAWLARAEGTADSADDDRGDVVSKLVAQAHQHHSIDELLDHAERQASKASSGSKPDPRRVQLMTIHRAKGLEWPVVFVAGFSEGLLPHEKGELSEERRLAYVAMTRARDYLYLLAPQSTYRGPSATSEFAIDCGLLTPTAAATGGVVA